MSSNYTLNLLNEKEFEIICLDKGHTAAILNLLKGQPFILKVSPVIEIDQDYPDKVEGETNDTEALAKFVNEWDDELNSQEVETYSDLKTE